MHGNQIYPPPSRAWLEVDLAALRRNALALRARAGVPLIPMVKADSYGVGCIAVVRALEPTQPWGYGVATVHEGMQLRAAGICRPIIVFTPILAADYSAARSGELVPSLCSAAAILEWNASGERPYHLAIDTGMNRAGVPWRDIDSVAEAVARFAPAGAFTHFHSAELKDGSVELQNERFRAALERLPVTIPFLHACNSWAIARAGSLGWDAVRPGVALYGVGSGRGAHRFPEPVIALRARVVDVRLVRAGDTVSYGGSWTAEHDERIATVAVGYADGYPRALSNRGRGLFKGAVVPVRGVVTMDMTMVSLGHAVGGIGDIVTLIGRDSGRRLTVEGVARTANMSPYELLTGLGRRLERLYVDE